GGGQVRAGALVVRDLELPPELVDARRDRPRRARTLAEAEAVVVDADLDVRARDLRLDRSRARERMPPHVAYTLEEDLQHVLDQRSGAAELRVHGEAGVKIEGDRKSTRLNSSHVSIS